MTDGWHASDARRCAELRRYYASFPWRSLAVSRFVDELIASGKLRPPKFPTPHARRDEAGEYEHPFSGEPMLDGMPHPGL